MGNIMSGLKKQCTYEHVPKTNYIKKIFITIKFNKLAIAFALSSVSLSSLAIISNNPLDDTTFLLGPLSNSNQCFSKEISVTDCAKPNQYTELQKQIFSFKNGQIRYALNNDSDYDACLYSSGGSLNWQRCSNSSSQRFEIKQHNNGATSYFTVVQNEQCITSSNSSLSMMTCDNSNSDQKLLPKMVLDFTDVVISNQNRSARDAKIYVTKSDWVLLDQYINRVVKGNPVTMQVPDMRSYTISGQSEKVQSSKWRDLNYSNENLRSGDKLEATISNQTYDIHGKKIVSYYPSLLKKLTPVDQIAGSSNGRLFDLIINNDQPDLGLFTEDSESRFAIPDGWMLRLYENPNYKGKITYLFDNSFKNDIKKTGSLVIEKNNQQGSSLQFISKKEEGRFGDYIISKYTNQDKFMIQIKGSYSQIGPYGLPYKKFETKVGYIFCDKAATEKPLCYVLKKDVKAGEHKDLFADKNLWLPFEIKAYQAGMKANKGELFYRNNTSIGKIEIWHLQQSGEVQPIPTDRTDNNYWKFTGYYRQSITTS